MSNTILTPKHGADAIKELLPSVMTTSANHLKLESVENNVLKLNISGQDLLLGWAEASRFTQLTGININMLGRLSYSLREKCWAELIDNLDDKELQLSVRGGRICDIADTTIPWPDRHKWTERIVEKVKPEGVSNVYAKGAKVGFGLTTNHVFKPVKRVDDIVQSGLYFRFDASGIRAQAYHMRLACTNGAIATRMDSAFALDDGNFDSLISDLLQKADLFAKGFVELDEKPLTDPGGLLGGLRRSATLSSVQADRILQQLATLNTDATEFDLVNAITAQQHLKLDDISWVEAGGRVCGQLHAAHCSRCAKPS